MEYRGGGEQLSVMFSITAAEISKFWGKSLSTGNESISIPSMLDLWAE